jgi:hypothetical protein
VTTAGGATVEVVAAGIGFGGFCEADAEGPAEEVVQDGYASAGDGSWLGQGVADAVGEVEAEIPVDGATDAESVAVGASVGEAESVVVGVPEPSPPAVAVAVSVGATLSVGAALSVGVAVSVAVASMAYPAGAMPESCVASVAALPGSTRSTRSPAGSAVVLPAPVARTWMPFDGPDHMGDIPPRTPGRFSSAASGMSSGCCIFSHGVQ